MFDGLRRSEARKIEMRLFVLGATGATGALFVDAAITRGHQVTAVVRDAQKLQPRDGLHVVSGDAREVDTLAGAMTGADAVTSALGVGSNRNPDHLIRDVTVAVLTAAERSDVRRVVWLSALGVGDSYATMSLPMRLGYRLAPEVFRDKADGERVLRASHLASTIVYPGVLTDGERTGDVTATDLDRAGRVPGMPRISRADVADFLLNAATTDEWDNRTVILTARRHRRDPELGRVSR